MESISEFGARFRALRDGTRSVKQSWDERFAYDTSVDPLDCMEFCWRVPFEKLTELDWREIILACTACKGTHAAVTFRTNISSDYFMDVWLRYLEHWVMPLLKSGSVGGTFLCWSFDEGVVNSGFSLFALEEVPLYDRDKVYVSKEEVSRRLEEAGCTRLDSPPKSVLH